jgi:hypothetical protein
MIAVTPYGEMKCCAPSRALQLQGITDSIASSGHI